MNVRSLSRVKTTPKPSFAPARTGLLQRKCACGGSPGMTGECDECSRKRLTLQRRSGSEARRSKVPPIVHDVLRSPGRSLDPDARASMEPRFGHDFSRVRVHADTRAAESAQAVDALAYTVGRDIVFAAGQYTPETTKGQRLLAHELAHVVQQSPHSTSTTSLCMSGDQDSAPEAEADRVADAVTNGQPLTTPISHQGYSVQRQEATEEERRRWMGAGTQPTYRLHLDPEIEAQAMTFRVSELLDPELIRLSLSRMDLDTIIGYQPPPWLTAPTVPEARPVVPRGAGPTTPRPASAGDVLKAVMGIPAVDTALSRLQKETKDRLSRERRRFSREWQSLSTPGKVAEAAVITESAVISAGVVGGAVAGVLSDPEALQFTLDKLQDTPLPTGVPGLNFQFNVTGPDKRIRFDLNVGALLPASWGFK